MSKISRRTWLITGCSTGLGRALAEAVIANGDNLVATARNADSLTDLVAGHETALALKLDVTDAADIAEAVAQAEARFGPVDVLVNNAGYGYLAAVEEGDADAYRALYETNVFGLMEVTRAVLPSMRQRGTGHVINISSVGGVIGNPGSGFYAGTKFAVVGFSEALSKEVGPLGVKVTVVQPGGFRTDWAGRSLQRAEAEIPAYAATVHERLTAVSGRSGRQPGDPARAAAAILAIVEAPQPPLHLVLGKVAADLVEAQFAGLQKELAAWRHLSDSADYPEG